MTIVGVLVATGKRDAVDVFGHTARVSVYTDDFRVEGCLHVGPKIGGHKGRVSDALNDQAGLLVLTEVTIHETNFSEGTKEPRQYEIFVLREDEIKFVIPYD